jgi:hypothetical protein
MKKKKPVDKPVPFMNKNLKRAIYKKRMSYNKYNRCKNKQNWEIYKFTLSHLSTIEFNFFCSKSFKKNSWSKFLKLLYSINFLFILGITIRLSLRQEIHHDRNSYQQKKMVNIGLIQTTVN